MAMLLLFCVVFMTGLGVVGIHYSMYFSVRPVGAGGAGSAKVPPDFGRSVNPIPTGGDKLI